MLKHVQEFGKYIAITGFKDVKIDDVDVFLEKARKVVGEDVEIQFFNAELVASWQHLFFAALNALKAFRNGENISKHLAVEMLLYASAQRQIRKATEVLGIKPGLKSIAVLIVGNQADQVAKSLEIIEGLLGRTHNDKVLELTPDKIANIRKAFGISDAEIEAIMNGKTLEQAIIDLVIERIALLATER